MNMLKNILLFCLLWCIYSSSKAQDLELSKRRFGRMSYTTQSSYPDYVENSIKQREFHLVDKNNYLLNNVNANEYNLGKDRTEKLCANLSKAQKFILAKDFNSANNTYEEALMIMGEDSNVVYARDQIYMFLKELREIKDLSEERIELQKSDSQRIISGKEYEVLNIFAEKVIDAIKSRSFTNYYNVIYNLQLFSSIKIARYRFILNYCNYDKNRKTFDPETRATYDFYKAACEANDVLIFKKNYDSCLINLKEGFKIKSPKKKWDNLTIEKVVFYPNNNYATLPMVMFYKQEVIGDIFICFSLSDKEMFYYKIPKVSLYNDTEFMILGTPVLVKRN